MNILEKPATHRPLRAKLIFNATAGRTGESPQQLADILNEMQSRNILPEVFMVRPDSQVEAVVRSAIKGGIKLVVVAGGDGTIDSVAGAMIGSSATLGIIPTGTRNNVAFNLGIPSTIVDAVALLREGRKLKLDIGYLRSGRAHHWFLEAATLGLLSDLYPAADNIQHGDLAQIANLLSTFVSSTPSRLNLTLDRRSQFDMSAYMVLIANMPYIGPHFQISPNVSYNDHRLDVFVFSDMSKLDLISYAMQSTGGGIEDARIKHYRVKRLAVQSVPQMPVLADGMLLEQGPVTAVVHSHALAIMGGAADVAMGERPIALPAIDRVVLPHA
jgi:YegS/Rv2252/BmrU family lipid kinase